MTAHKLGTLVAIPIKGRKLINRTGGKQSPYVQLKLGEQKKRTKASLIASVEPEWDQEIRLDVFHGELAMSVAVHDDGKKDELIGDGVLLLNEVIDKGELDVWFPIKYNGTASGDIYFELTFYASAPPPVSGGTPPTPQAQIQTPAHHPVGYHIPHTTPPTSLYGSPPITGINPVLPGAPAPFPGGMYQAPYPGINAHPPFPSPQPGFPTQPLGSLPPQQPIIPPFGGPAPGPGFNAGPGFNVGPGPAPFRPAAPFPNPSLPGNNFGGAPPVSGPGLGGFPNMPQMPQPGLNGSPNNNLNGLPKFPVGPNNGPNNFNNGPGPNNFNNGPGPNNFNNGPNGGPNNFNNGPNNNFNNGPGPNNNFNNGPNNGPNNFNNNGPNNFNNNNGPNNFNNNSVRPNNSFNNGPNNNFNNGPNNNNFNNNGPNNNFNNGPNNNGPNNNNFNNGPNNNFNNNNFNNNNRPNNNNNNNNNFNGPPNSNNSNLSAASSNGGPVTPLRQYNYSLESFP